MAAICDACHALCLAVAKVRCAQAQALAQALALGSLLLSSLWSPSGYATLVLSRRLFRFGPVWGKPLLRIE